VGSENVPAIAKPAPSPNDVTRFYWDAACEHRLMVLRCDDCSYYIHWPQERCTRCGSERVAPSEVSGRGIVFTFTVVHHMFHPGFKDDMPYNLALVELVEQPGLRVMSNIVECRNEDLRVGMAVEVTFEDRDGHTVPQFRPAKAT
jgi:uncharacterized OB-fold protein